MTTPDPTPDTKLEVQELTDENLEEVSGGRPAVPLDASETDIPTEKIGNNSFGAIIC
jgi:hypothetical protein